FDKKMAEVKHRETMTKMLTRNKLKSSRGELKYCNEEVENKLSGETLELMDLLTKKHPEHKFSFIIGSDNLPSFKKWSCWEKLVKKYLLWIVSRAGYDIDLKKYGLDKPKYKFKIVEHPLLIVTNISSTIIRNRVKQGLSITNLVPRNIKNYIIKHGLYK
ncbi:unnamed protein product, partial [marine sediment metagenome]